MRFLCIDLLFREHFLFSDMHTEQSPLKMRHSSERYTPTFLFLIQDPLIAPHPTLLVSFNPLSLHLLIPPCVTQPPLKWANQSSLSSQIVFSMTKENLCDHLCLCLYMHACVCVCVCVCFQYGKQELTVKLLPVKEVGSMQEIHSTCAQSLSTFIRGHMKQSITV